ncbi:MAG: histidine--tRNA ligase [Kiritimatiellia bacterium]|jgi:histidyl-tRNA synthetase|nr:histidine--tRNA ligase [Kiritimatiellia bacterium]MDP6629693.1 histidine--tRNA ligase [Kiritimatiellia bacterium]MDP6810932.1 histidine--tRNA ligase [Kiritimatiellia bacterium]MDP7023237.1 histidine--tRNA ligase [Kiritimatiellia bacterium]
MSKDKQSLAAPRGMRDFYPSDMAAQMRLFDTWRSAAEQYGFQRYDACVVESLDLLKRKAGEEIVDQTYWFRDKSDRELALRPEMTPTLARMVAARQGSLEMPIKWYTIAQCFRYERTTRGRKREHYQLNLDIIGETAVTAEVEVIASAVNALLALGLTQSDFRVRISSRALLSDILTAGGIAPDHHAATFLALDKRGKLADDKIKELLTDAGVSAETQTAVFAVLTLTNLNEVRTLLGDRDSQALRDLEDCMAGLTAYGLEECVTFDISVIRGLAYYTGIVFEAFDVAGKFRAIFGGGRYDNLLASVGGRPQTGVGLGFGDVVVAELLADKGLLTEDGARSRVTVGYMAPEQQDAAVKVAATLRADGEQVDLALHAEKPRAFFSRADKRAFARGVYIGPDDVASGQVRIKDLVTREEETLDLG